MFITPGEWVFETDFAWANTAWFPAGEYLPPVTVVLTVAHLDHTPEHSDPDNLQAMCQFCHLNYDSDHHARTRRDTRDAASGQHRLFPED